MIKKFVFLVLTIALGWGVYNTVIADRSVGTEVGDKAADFTLTTLDGEKVSLSDYKGKPVFLNFWATWCPPCEEEMPDIQSFADAHREEVIVLSVNFTKFEPDKEAIPAFVEANELRFPILMDREGTVGENLYKVISMPTSFMVDGEGVIREKRVGPLTLDEMENWLDEVK
ncbi:redoxin domain-containing protein [Alkalihalobacillus macyae]|uniref:redoxin domain-containing protein n=1 Tax=Guptibacillus hwajinpoensis TaxID=208199 RepID=UPI00273CEC98|nr:redoxin domain-containing protein [Alkalihalobacillus macyae]MDP4551800.1 redoxin domain-containing protein [Alkalihalobacillus macyae]